MKKALLFSFLMGLFWADSFAQTTWSNTIAKIIYANCSVCHRPGAIAPFSLMDYHNAYTMRSSIRYDVTIRKMPPWPPDVKYNRMAHERILSDQQIASIQNWVDSGAVRGDSTTEPAAPVFNDKSQLSRVDFTFHHPAYTVKNTSDDYRVYVLKSGLTKDRNIKSLEFLPGNRKIVHHILFFYDNTGKCAKLDKADPLPGYASSGGGVGVSEANLIGAWVPGQGIFQVPSGMGINIPKGADLVMQIHYAPGSKGRIDSTLVNISYDSVSSLRNVYLSPILNHSTNLVNGPLYIKAGASKWFHEKYTVPVDVSVLAIAPHMHNIGKKFKVYSVDSNNDTTRLINIDNWDFHWQGQYQFRKLMKIKAYATLYADAWYDNTTGNDHNPNSPPKDVSLGESTLDEMMLVYFSFLAYKPGDEKMILDSSNLVTDIEPSIVSTLIPSSINVYPNPAHGLIHIDLKDQKFKSARISVLDISGRLLLEKSFVSGTNTADLDATLLPHGLYLLKIITDEAIETRRMVIE